MFEASGHVFLANMEVGKTAFGPGERRSPLFARRTGSRRKPTRQHSAATVLAVCQIPHGVESTPKADKGTSPEPGNFLAASSSETAATTKATGDRRKRGRSLRSSPRAGKPSTWRREAVDTACRQEVDECPTR